MTIANQQLLAALTALIQSGVLNAALPKAATKRAKSGGKFGSKSQKFPAFQAKTGGAEVDPVTERKLQFEVAVRKGFNARGFKNHELELRSDGTNGVLSYKGWLKVGRQVRKGQRGVKGCFHYSQTDKIDTAAVAADMQKAVAEHKAKPQPAPQYSDSDLVVA